MTGTQLNFITGYDSNSEEVTNHLEFWDKSYNIVVKNKTRSPKYASIEKFFNSLNYSEVPTYKSYWEQISPTDTSEQFKRWLFAFMSVHTSWKSNIVGYQAIKDWWTWMNKDEQLLQKISDSRVGMQNNRLRFISEFSHKFWSDPSRYKKDKSESWRKFRNRLKDITLGLGAAKTSFAVEMCYPNSAEVACLDTHMFQAYGLDQISDAKFYPEIEQHWVDMAKMWNIPPYIARCIYWDKKQGHTDSRYWSYVLEK
jgi:hypothetical protein